MFIRDRLYLLEAAGGTGKAVWVLDRPNPAGRPVEGTTLLAGWESFVGAGPMPMRHGMTLGEMGRWFVDHFKLDVDYRVVAMEGWEPEGPGFGWPQDRIWINPSPNAASLNMARAYAGTVMIEGATLSEGRGTTRPLEVLFGAPDVDAKAVLAELQSFAPGWLAGGPVSVELPLHRGYAIFAGGLYAAAGNLAAVGVQYFGEHETLLSFSIRLGLVIARACLSPLGPRRTRLRECPPPAARAPP